MTPFYGWSSTASKLEPLRGGSLLFTTKFPQIPGTHFIDLGRMKGWVDLGATRWFALILIVRRCLAMSLRISPCLYSLFHPCIIVLWTYLRLKNACTMEVNMDWRFLIISIFMDPLNWLKIKQQRSKKT